MLPCFCGDIRRRLPGATGCGKGSGVLVALQGPHVVAAVWLQRSQLLLCSCPHLLLALSLPPMVVCCCGVLPPQVSGERVSRAARIFLPWLTVGLFSSV